MKVVFDTNVFISVFIISGGQADLAFRLARQQRFDLCTSVPILAEVAQTLRGKFGQSEEDITEALRMISRAAEIVKPSAALQVLSDVPDNRILECAVEAGADLIVTGDRHVLKLKQYESTSIVRLADFLRMFPDT
ncbi:MAG TPA: putative toxin-antitoxin system toxin component, PIN family [Methylomirabilota bacterium]|nr:putative toxin-antitoxin system toxin component, PIN family [Methylomirabilota bacterium]